MHISYFKTAWADIKNSPGWLPKMLLLGLVSLIPVFGTIVVAGYLYGWARDIAWNVHAPLPARIFGNEDGRLYSRGFFALVIAFVFSLLPAAIELVGSFLGATPFLFLGGGHHRWMLGAVSSLIGLLVFFAMVASVFFVQFFTWVGSMRMSVYGRLSAGFQLEKIWAMMRRDFGGIVRVFGMYLILCAVACAVVLVVVGVAVLVGIVSGAAVVGLGLDAGSLHSDSMPWGAFFALGGAAFLLVVLLAYAASVFSAFATAMTVRAMGYWTRQFDVPAWRGQDDPLPFETQAAPSAKNG